MSLIIEMEFVTYEIATFITVLFYLYRINKSRKEETQKEIEKIVQQIILSEEFERRIRKTVKEALNESQEFKVLNQIIVVLCTYIPELKNSKLCNP
ncbi:hypothetical protein AFV8_gp38 [Betalipothrixvirus puteoliense]|uniref:Uncharacterized protein n=1 Tax=Betalipothrixvirus puteoliense TaxID=346884 RepID=A7WKW8_9VIRU|nr:hypothetical protein AFV8_gp38 [Acidianus filamentous virus 8]CAJ31715.1 conserved hypothetical protein [Acidianus filamentous virus 8]